MFVCVMSWFEVVVCVLGGGDVFVYYFDEVIVVLGECGVVGDEEY